ncbi:putative phosphoglycerate/bisphosphoglycerate mutase [Glutamicibacter uratoxydans]|uniref:Putative phosphoglycerate/bisphosphoglycerate mutase n=1 Tax=Glutamicibacter uratoxydans TaxID=43667 RepID=A0A4Y4DNN0_GLUUR|nr:histidine phosphatase family protein [Glutamicibacter uratoxydans]GED06203.1 putative phosphoglycerate/bisphosphoglycerate mutase [Glutamicibacter uratoxydans]
MNPIQSRRLILMRHAKADYPLGVADHERPLAARGNREAPAAGAWLVENNLIPDYIICSDALRTRSTCAWVLSELGEKGPTPYIDSRMYSAGTSALCSIINEVPDTVSTLLVIGHQPVLQELALRLASAQSDEESVYELAMNYPTLGTTVLETAHPYSHLDSRDCNITHFVVPRP